MANSEEFVVYCGGAHTRQIAGQILKVSNTMRPDQKDLEIGHIDFRRWRDREANDMFDRFEDIAGRHAILFLSPRDEHHVMQLLFFTGALKGQYQAKSVTLVMPFMIYRRQDRLEKKKINRNLIFLQLLKTAGADRILLCDIHSEATLKNAKKVGLKVVNVDPTPAYVKALTDVMAQAKEAGDLVRGYSPDLGSIVRTITLAKELNIPVTLNLKARDIKGQPQIVEPAAEDIVMLEKLRKKHNFSDISFPDESLKDSIIIMREDEADTCGTARKTGERLRELGAKDIYLCATHAVLADEWKEQLLDDTPFTFCFLGNTIRRTYEDSTGGFVHEVDMSVVIGHQLAAVMDSL